MWGNNLNLIKDTFFPNTKFQVFAEVFGSKFQLFFKFFMCQIPGTCTFIQILVIKILKCVKTDNLKPECNIIRILENSDHRNFALMPNISLNKH